MQIKRNDSKPKPKHIIRIQCPSCNGTGKQYQSSVIGDPVCKDCHGVGFQSVLIEGKIQAILIDVGME